METLDIASSTFSVNDAEQLDQLSDAADYFFSELRNEEYLKTWFGLFERFPQDDAFGVFWTILHGIEKYPNYQTYLLQSLQNQPSVKGIEMIHRILNSGFTKIEDVELVSFLENIGNITDPSSEVYATIENILEFYGDAI